MTNNLWIFLIHKQINLYNKLNQGKLKSKIPQKLAQKFPNSANIDIKDKR